MKENKHFYTAMYLRLSRDDKIAMDDNTVPDNSDSGENAGISGVFKAESNSISSQREMIRSFISSQIWSFMTAMWMMAFPAAITTDRNLKE